MYIRMPLGNCPSKILQRAANNIRHKNFNRVNSGVGRLVKTKPKYQSNELQAT